MGLSSPLPDARIHDDKKKQRIQRDKLSILHIPYKLVFDAPVLEDSVAYAICETRRVLPLGNHDLFIGHVIGAIASLDFDEYWKFKSYDPILYLGSGKRTRRRQLQILKA
jgi:flavin reductase (DIM6/NTAB) family NADH-FMN oxidoreductase RutF